MFWLRWRWWHRSVCLLRCSPGEGIGLRPLGWFALLGSSVAAMAVVMQVNGDPAASTTNTIAFGLFALVGLTVAVLLLRPLLARGLMDLNSSAGVEGTSDAR